jgi:diguanylate cyclase (GGDEF)-like protein
VRRVRRQRGGWLWVLLLGPWIAALAGDQTVRWLAQQTVPELEGSLTLEVDAGGALWVGGKRGLRRWDGQSWWKPPGVPAETIRDLAFDAEGQLWVASERGLGYWRDGNWTEVASLPGEITERVQLLPRVDGLWLATIGSIRRYRPDAGLTVEPGLPEVSWYGLTSAADGALLAAGRRGLYRRGADGVWQGPLGPAELVFQVLDARDGTRWIGGFALHQQSPDGTWSAAEPAADLRFIREMVELPDGSLWVGTHGNGLHVRDPEGHWHRGEARLTGEMITAILPDAQQNVWVATEGGDLHQFQRGPMAVVEREQGLPGRLLAAVATAADGSLCLSSYGTGLYRVDPDRLVLTAVDSPCGAEVRTLVGDGERLWMGTALGLCERSAAGEIRLHRLPFQVDAIAQAGDALWLSSPYELRYWRDGALQQQYGATDGLPPSVLYRLLTLADGSLWAGGSGGLWRRGADGATSVLHTAAVQALQAEPSVGPTAFWVLTEGALLLIDGLRIRARLPVDARHWLLLTDAADGLWLFGPEHAERWPHAALVEALSLGTNPPAPRRYGPREGLEPLKSVVIGGPSQTVLPDGRHALAGYGRLLLGRLEALAPIADPLARIDGLSDRDGVALDRAVSMAPERLPVRIAYSAPLFRETGLLRFRHRLLPLEPGWSAPGSARQQVYATLAGGDYRFEVQALPLDGRDPGVTGIAAVEFRIAPRWYERGTVQLALVGSALLGSGLLLRVWLSWRTRRLLKRQQALTQLVEERTRQLAEANRQLAALARTDALTGLANRRGFEEALAEHWPPRGAPLALILLDVDHFKAYNDRYGHPEGDACLRSVGAVIAELAGQTPEIVIAARYGGEEFALLLRADADGAAAIAERLRGAVAARALPHAGNPGPGVVTVSLGVAGSEGPWPDAAALIDAADRALYRAKRAGRNRVEVEAAA